MKVFIALSTTMLVVLFHGYAFGYPNGVSGYTKKSGTAGCSCHGGSYFNTSVLVKIEGPDTLTPGQTANYTCTVSGGPSTSAGVDIASSVGALNPVSTFLKILNGELTQKNSVPYSGGKVIFQFTYTAPTATGTQTLYATGSSKKYWNWADNKTVLVKTQTPLNVTVTFQADMGAQVYRGLFNRTSDSLFVRGSYQAAAGDPGGNWQGYKFKMSDPDGDTIYSATAEIPVTLAGTSYEYKFVKNADTWETNPNRSFTLASANQALPVCWFSNDSSYASNLLTRNIPILSGWNILSVPVLASNMSVSALFPAATSAAFSYNNGYVSNTSLLNGSGYWLRFPADGTVPVSGQATANSASVSAGWNLIGTGGSDVPVSGITTTPPNIITSQFYGYANGYLAPQTLAVGKGYWLRVSQAGTVIFNVTAAKMSSGFIPSETAVVTITDAAGNSATLRLLESSSDVARYDLPPLPPAGIFDARFTGGSSAARIADGPAVISVQSALYPLQLQSNAKTTLRVRDAAASGKILDRELRPGETLTLDNTALSLIEISGAELQPRFELAQNYPNPFNPSTLIRFSIPAGGGVTLSVYNALGEHIATPVNGVKEAGNYSVQFDAGALPSGMYYYRLRAGEYSETKKMLLMR